MNHCSSIGLKIVQIYLKKSAGRNHNHSTLTYTIRTTNQSQVSPYRADIAGNWYKKRFSGTHIQFLFSFSFSFVIMFQLIYSVSFLLFIKNCSFYIITHLVFCLIHVITVLVFWVFIFSRVDVKRARGREGRAEWKVEWRITAFNSFLFEFISFVTLLWRFFCFITFLLAKVKLKI